VSERKVETAYHEAGHAVACVVLGESFEYVSTIENDQSRGRCKWLLDGFHPDLLSYEDDGLERIELVIHCLWAGPLAAERYAGRFDGVGATQDLGTIRELCNYLVGGPEELELVVDEYKQRTLDLLARPEMWANVAAVANGLLAKDELTHNDVRVICAL
jgi:hypothetical protein